MSNVLIGIIGVILFIGLALAGAVFLGPRFQSATAESDAATIVSQLQQMTQAVEMYRIRTGNLRIDCQTVEFLVPRFLKEVPVSPTRIARDTASSYMYKPQLNNDIITDATPQQAAGYEALYITTNLGPGERAQSACRAISKTYGQDLRDVTEFPTEVTGCGRIAGEYVTWQRI